MNNFSQLICQRNKIPSTSKGNLYFANNLQIEFYIPPPATFLHCFGVANLPASRAEHKYVNSAHVRFATIRLELYW